MFTLYWTDPITSITHKIITTTTIERAIALSMVVEELAPLGGTFLIGDESGEIVAVGLNKSVSDN